MNFHNAKIYPMDLSLFDSTVNTTGSASSGNNLSAEMRTFYSDLLIDNVQPLLVHDQFGQKRNIPKNQGKVIQFRKYDPLPKATTPLVEGVTPDGQPLNVTAITTEIKQYGGVVIITDLLLLTAIDNNLVEATELLSAQAGQTLDTVTREVLNGGTNVQYASGQVSSRASLVGGSATASENHYLTVDSLQRAARFLKKMNAPKINGWYIGIIHPDTAFDLMKDDDWKAPHEYVDTKNIYNGEVGSIAGFRLIETSEAKVWEKAGTDKSTGSAKTASRDVYSTLCLGANAYGVTAIENGGLQNIIKQLGSGGTSDPLDQRATAGWKATKAVARLVESNMVRIETCSTFNS